MLIFQIFIAFISSFLIGNQDIKISCVSSDVEVFISYNVDGKSTIINKLNFSDGYAASSLPAVFQDVENNQIITCVLYICKPHTSLNTANLSNNKDIYEALRFNYEKDIEINVANKHATLTKYGVNNLVVKNLRDIDLDFTKQQSIALKEYKDKIAKTQNQNLINHAKLTLEQKKNQISYTSYLAKLDLIERYPGVKFNHFLFDALLYSKLHFDENKIKSVYSKLTNLDKDLKAKIDVSIEKQIDLKRITNKETGEQFLLPALKLQLANSRQISLESIYGEKLTIIDIWASWCAPCRIKHPYYANFYKKLKDKGLEIVSLSIDKNSDDWKKAVNDDGMIWKNFMIEGGIKNEFITKLNIEAVPANFVVNRKNQIIGKNLTIEQMNALLYKQLMVKEGRSK